jgi:hypothetical protein
MEDANKEHNLDRFILDLKQGTFLLFSPVTPLPHGAEIQASVGPKVHLIYLISQLDPFSRGTVTSFTRKEICNI